MLVRNLERPFSVRVAVWCLVIVTIAITRLTFLQETVPLAEFSDDGEYMHLAENILSGHSYSDLGLVVDPDFVRPREEMRSAYPIGYPLVIAALWSVFGHSIFVLKILNVLSVLAAMVPISLLVGELAGDATIGLVLSVLWFVSPITIESAEMVQSDLPFVAAVFWFLYFWELLLRNSASNRKNASALAGLGVALFAVVTIRSVGIALFPAILAHETWSRRKLPVSSAIVCAIAALLLTVLSHLVPRPGPGYLGAFHGMSLHAFAQSVIDNVQGERWKFALAVDPGFGGGKIGTVLGTALLVLAAIGTVCCLIHRAAAVVFFFIFYVLIVAIFPDNAAWARYLLPVIPLVFCLAIVGVKALSRHRSGAATHAIWLLIGGLTMSALGAAVRSPLWRPVRIGYPIAATQGLLNAVKARTAPHDTVAFFYPYLITMYAERPTLRIWPQQVQEMTPKDLVCRYTELGVKYVVLKTSKAQTVTQF